MTHNDAIHILQFGTGNFLRAFFEPMVQDLNESNNQLNICIIQSTSGNTLEKLQAQNYQYHVLEAGIKNGQNVQQIRKITRLKDGLKLPEEQEKFLAFAEVSSVKWIISNVTEAGMVMKKEGPFEKFAESFAGRLTQWLYRRFTQNPSLETVILPCELITKNGDLLKSFVLEHSRNWSLGEGFESWLNQKVFFFNNLVDRIVPGYPSHLELEEKKTDSLLVQTEPYSFWAIEGKESDKILLPFLESKAEVILKKDISPYALRKIRILNGCHTYMAAKGLVLGYISVGEFMADPKNEEVLNSLVDLEIIPFLGMDETELKNYKQEIFSRFKNPFVEHKLADISLNSIAKFKSRLLPLIEPYKKSNKGQSPKEISKGLLFLILYYLENPDKIRDTEEVKALFSQLSEEVNKKNKVKYVIENLFDLEWNSSLEDTFEDVLEEIKKSN
ncbi:tagaturonate reductase [Algoriphagus boseongensis]|uniref:Tagaturonate reductase n=1 Tax=Algoriphagus boseongensis TaxID=1442587 RepID=A0A4R6T908_9BACT|nr:tagaturonate reductase [Algoriphagus boseongensis]TDQ19226.1 tagaturonate reductase [Algoriphagus boseongensis]